MFPSVDRISVRLKEYNRSTHFRLFLSLTSTFEILRPLAIGLDLYRFILCTLGTRGILIIQHFDLWTLFHRLDSLSV